MAKMTLTILAKDIRETDYTVSRDCAITRALHRAGFTNLRDSGYSIRNEDYENIIHRKDNEAYDKMVAIVIGMYGTHDDQNGNPNCFSDKYKRVPIEDRVFEIEY